jgi:hypothetical protein
MKLYLAENNLRGSLPIDDQRSIEMDVQAMAMNTNKWPSFFRDLNSQFDYTI